MPSRQYDYEYFEVPNGVNAIEIRNLHENYRYGDLKRRKPAKIKVIDPEDGFSFGNCATVAITRAFKIDFDITKELFHLMGANPSKGCTWRECDKCISSLCRIKGRMCRYTTNKTHISSTTFYQKNKKGIFILNFENHLSVLKNGTVYDSWIGEKGFRAHKLMGWWEIK